MPARAALWLQIVMQNFQPGGLAGKLCAPRQMVSVSAE